MIMIGNLQYAWTLCVQPMMNGTGWKLSQLQWGFTIFIAVMLVAGTFRVAKPFGGAAPKP